MKKFRYRMEPLLRLKEHIEKEKQKTLAVAAQKVISQKGSLDNIRQDRSERQDSQRNCLVGPIDKGRLAVYTRYFIKLRKDEFTGKEMLKLLEQDENSKRDELIVATKEKKSFEKLKDRLKDRHDKENALLTQKEMDEVASQLFQYKKRLPA